MRQWILHPHRRRFFWMLALFTASTAVAAPSHFFDDGTDLVD